MTETLSILIRLIADIYLVCLLLRFALEDRQFYFNPLLRPIYKITEPLLAPLRSILPTVGRGRSLAPLLVAAIVILLLGLAEALLARLPLRYGLLLGLSRYIDLTLQFFLVLLVVRALEVYSGFDAPSRLMAQATDPFLYPLSRLTRLPRRGSAALAALLFLAAHWGFYVLLSAGHLVPPSAFLFPGPTGHLQGMLAAHTILVARGAVHFLSLVVLIGVLLSWVGADPNNFLTQLIWGITKPLLDPIRRVLPLVFGGFDFTPIVAIVALGFVATALGRIAAIVAGLAP